MLGEIIFVEIAGDYYAVCHLVVSCVSVLICKMGTILSSSRCVQVVFDKCYLDLTNLI